MIMCVRWAVSTLYLSCLSSRPNPGEFLLKAADPGDPKIQLNPVVHNIRNSPSITLLGTRLASSDL